MAAAPFISNHSYLFQHALGVLAGFIGATFSSFDGIPLTVAELEIIRLILAGDLK